MSTQPFNALEHLEQHPTAEMRIDRLREQREKLVEALTNTWLLFDKDHHRLGLSATKRFADQMEINQALLAEIKWKS